MCCLAFKTMHHSSLHVGRMGNLSVKPSDAKAGKKPPKASQSKKAMAAASLRAPGITNANIDFDSTMDSSIDR